MSSQVDKGEEHINGPPRKRLYVQPGVNRKAHPEQTSQGPTQNGGTRERRRQGLFLTVASPCTANSDSFDKTTATKTDKKTEKERNPVQALKIIS